MINKCYDARFSFENSVNSKVLSVMEQFSLNVLVGLFEWSGNLSFYAKKKKSSMYFKILSNQRIESR